MGKLQDITNQFKNSRIRYNDITSELLINSLYKMGFKWTGSGDKKTPNYLPYEGYIFVDKDCRLTYGGVGYGIDKNNAKEFDKFYDSHHAINQSEKFVKTKKEEYKNKRFEKRRQKFINTTFHTNRDTTLNRLVFDELKLLGFSFYEPKFAEKEAFWITAHNKVNGNYLSYSSNNINFNETYRIADVHELLPNWKKDKTKKVNKFKTGGYTKHTPTKISQHPSMPHTLKRTDVVEVLFRNGTTRIAEAYDITWCSIPSYKREEVIGYKLVGRTMPKIEKEAKTDTNPKRQYGVSSIPMGLWPALASAYGAVTMYNGAGKYGKNNFKATEVEASIYIDAAKRHLDAWAEGEEFDPKDGCPNLGGVLANVAILIEARAAGTLIDDRNIGIGYLQERDKLAEIVKSLNELHKDKNPKHYTRNTV